jgi:hypothetical protein
LLKVIFHGLETRFLQTIFEMSEEGEVGWCEIKSVRWVHDQAEPIFFTKGSAFSGGVRSCVVGMNNESPLINVRAEQKKFRENINTALIGIKYIAVWKRLE